MLQLDIATIALDAKSDQPVLFMKPYRSTASEERLLPIALGHPEAMAILVALQGVNTPRPLTHDLLASVLNTLDVHLARVEISGFDSGTFFAELTLTMDGESFDIDARPSDAIALAVRTHAPVFMDDRLFQETSVLRSSVNLAAGPMRGGATSPLSGLPTIHEGLDLPTGFARAHAAPPKDAEETKVRFREFLDGVKPDDF